MLYLISDLLCCLSLFSSALCSSSSTSNSPCLTRLLHRHLVLVYQIRYETRNLIRVWDAVGNIHIELHDLLLSITVLIEIGHCILISPLGTRPATTVVPNWSLLFYLFEVSVRPLWNLLCDRFIFFIILLTFIILICLFQIVVQLIILPLSLIYIFCSILSFLNLII